MSDTPPAKLIDWKGKEWTPDAGRPAAHANARFTCPASQNPIIDSAWDDPKGVQISAFIFGGRRSTTVPLVYQPFNWTFGVYMAATMGSEMTAAAAGTIGQVRRDPFAMLPFCGYHMADYFNHWLQFGRDLSNPPRIFSVNWFRKDEHGKFIWPGFGDNSRVLEWVFNRSDDKLAASAPTVESPIGYHPALPSGLNTKGLKLSDSDVRALFEVDKAAWTKEIGEIKVSY